MARGTFGVVYGDEKSRKRGAVGSAAEIIHGRIARPLFVQRNYDVGRRRSARTNGAVSKAARACDARNGLGTRMGSLRQDYWGKGLIDSDEMLRER